MTSYPVAGCDQTVQVSANQEMSAEVSDRGRAVRSRDERSHFRRKAAIMTPPTSGATARRMFGLVQPIGLIPYATYDPPEPLMPLALRNYWHPHFPRHAPP